MVGTESCTQCERLVLSGAMPGTLGAVCPHCLVQSVFDSGESPRTPADLLIGRELGGHVLVGLLGQGGMGVVYRARQRELGRYVALKVLNPVGEARAADVQRFVGEARAAAKLSHPNIVSVHEVGQDAGFHYFTMDLVEGMSLAERLQEGPLPPRGAAGIVAKTARAIHAAHERGILHRDLKPANVLLAGDEPKVTDFGLAKDLTRLVRVTRSGAVMGSPSYMAPEQALGEATDARTDVYGLGAVLYECLTGRPPFGGREVAETLGHLLRDDPAPIRRDHPSVPREMEVICLKALAKEPERRYHTAAELADELERHLRDEPILARPEGILARARRRVRRNPWAWAGIASTAALAALGGILIALGWFRGGEEPTRVDRTVRAAVQEVQDKRERALRHVEAARRLNAQGQYLEARTAADEALAIDAECAEAWYEAGYAQEHTGELAAAREAYDQAVLHRPGWNEAHYRRVLAHVTYGDMDTLMTFTGLFSIPDFETVRDSLEALQRWESVPEYHHTVAAIVAMAEDDRSGDEALRELDLATDANPRHADAWFLKGIACYREALGSIDLPSPEAAQESRRVALEALQRGLELEPRRVEAYMLMTYLHSTNGDLVAALGCAARPVEVAPERPASYLVRALARTMLGIRELALEDVESAIRLNPGSALPYLVRPLVRCLRVEAGHVSIMISDPEALRPDLDRAIELDPELPLPYALRAIVRLADGDREGGRSDTETLRRLSAGYSFGYGFMSNALDGIFEDQRPEVSLLFRALSAFRNQSWDELDAVATELLAMPGAWQRGGPGGGEWESSVPGRDMALWFLAVAARERGDLARATQRLREAIDAGLAPSEFATQGWEEVPIEDPVIRDWLRRAGEDLHAHGDIRCLNCERVAELERQVQSLEEALSGLAPDSESRAGVEQALQEARAALESERELRRAADHP